MSVNSCALVMNQTPSVCKDEMTFVYRPNYQSLYISLELIIAVLAVIGNLLVCLVITRTKKLRRVTNYFLLSLAVADILVGLVAIPCAVLTDLGRPHHNLPLCLLMLSVLMVLTQSSILSLLAVAAERYMAILLPFQYQRLMSHRAACLALLLTWSLAVLSGCVPFIDWQKQPENSVFCTFACVIDMSFMVYSNFFCFLLLPLIAMFVIYARIFLIIRGQVRRICQARTRTISSGSDEGIMDTSDQRPSTDAIFTVTNPSDPHKVIKALRSRRKMQKANSLFLLLFLFAVCWIPIHVINCISFFCPTCDVPMSLTLVAILMSHANSALNPLLYAYRMRSFRRALIAMWRAVWSCKQN